MSKGKKGKGRPDPKPTDEGRGDESTEAEASLETEPAPDATDIPEDTGSEESESTDTDSDDSDTDTLETDTDVDTDTDDSEAVADVDTDTNDSEAVADANDGSDADGEAEAHDPAAEEQPGPAVVERKPKPVPRFKAAPNTPPSVLIPVAPGTNRNEELALAFRAAGAAVLQYPLQGIRDGEVKLADHQILALPGGFSYGDALGAGRLLALDLVTWFGDQLKEAIDRHTPIFGVCNGFQALVNAGVLPGGEDGPSSNRSGEPRPTATLADNANGRFECRWVTMARGSADSVWTSELTEPIRCPVAHGEGRFVAPDTGRLEADDRIALRYADPDGSPAGGRYPANPNGSDDDIAGVVDATGLVIGLMPHPEDHVFARQDPQRRRGVGGNCLPLFIGGVRSVVA